MLRGLLKKKNNIKQNIITDSKELYKLNAEREFSYAIEFVNNAIEEETKIEDKIKMIDFIMDLIKEDIKTDLLTKIIYNPKANITRYFPFPTCYYDKNNNAHRLHSIASGIMCYKGKIKAKKIDITPLYDHVYTNGVYWYNTHTNNILTTLTDFRIGILYEISKIKNNLANV